MQRTVHALTMSAFCTIGLLAGIGRAHAQYQAVELNATGGDAHSSAGGQQVGVGVVMASGYYGMLFPTDHAMAWSGSASSEVDLNPFNGWSEAMATDGKHQVGDGAGAPTNSQTHALLWAGSAASVIDLHPVGWTSSSATGVSGSQQVGYATNPPTATGSHRGGVVTPITNAFLWNGTAAGAINLNPAGMESSEALGIAGNQQVGWGQSIASGSLPAALLWTGTAASAVNLNPVGFVESEALGTDGARQVGYCSTLVPAYYGGTSVNPHAFLWSCTAASGIDLNPAGYASSEATAIYGSRQVGYGMVSGHFHALLWSGSAASAQDLNAYLPYGFTDAQAEGIDAAGNVVGYASNQTSTVPVLWVSSMAPPTPPVIVAPPVAPPAPTPLPSGGGSGGGGGGGGGGGATTHSTTDA